MVNRCICYKCTFREILNLINSGYSFNEALEKTGAGSGCGMCLPYIKLSVLLDRDSHDPGDTYVHKEEIANFNPKDLGRDAQKES